MSDSSVTNNRPNLAAIFDLIHKSQQATNSVELDFVLVNLTKQLVDYDQAFLYREGVGICAISGLSEIDVHSPMLMISLMILENLMQSGLQRA